MSQKPSLVRVSSSQRHDLRISLQIHCRSSRPRLGLDAMLRSVDAWSGEEFSASLDRCRRALVEADVRDVAASCLDEGIGKCDIRGIFIFEFQESLCHPEVVKVGAGGATCSVKPLEWLYGPPNIERRSLIAWAEKATRWRPWFALSPLGSPGLRITDHVEDSFSLSAGTSVISMDNIMIFLPQH